MKIEFRILTVCLLSCLIASIGSAQLISDDPCRILPPSTSQQVRGLIRHLVGYESGVRQDAAITLGRLGAAEAVPCLMDLLLIDEDQNVRSAAGWAIVQIGEPAIPTLLYWLKREPTTNTLRSYRAISTAVLNKMPPRTFISALKNPDSNVREHSISTLTERGAAVVPDLMQALRGSDRNIRLGIIQVLGNMGKEAKPALSLLIECLKDNDIDIRSYTTNAIERMGEIAVPSLIQVLKDNDKLVQKGAIQILGNMGTYKVRDAVPSLIQCLKSEDESVRQYSERALKQIGAPAVTSLLKAMGDDDKQIQQATGKILLSLGGKELYSSLIANLSSNDKNVRDYAVDILVKRGRDALPNLISALKGNDAQTNQYVAKIILELDQKETIPSLVLALRDDDNGRVAMLIENLGPLVLPPLIQAQKNDENQICRRAADIMEKFETKEVIPVLIETLKDSDDNIRSYAALVLVRKGPQALPDLIKAIQDNNKQVRQGVIRILGDMGAQAGSAIPALYQVLKDKDVEIRKEAILVLPKLFLNPKEAIQMFSRALMEIDYDDVRKNAAEELGKIGVDAKGAIPALIQVLKSRNGDVRLSAIGALIKIGANETVVAALIPLLRDSDNAVRQRAIESLGKIGPAAKAAVQPLTQILRDGDKTFQNYAIEALEKIGTSDALNVVRVYRQREKAEVEAIRAKAEAEQKRRFAHAQEAKSYFPTKLNVGYYYNIYSDANPLGKLWEYRKCTATEFDGGELLGTFQITQYPGSVRVDMTRICAIREDAVYLVYAKSPFGERKYVVRPIILKIPRNTKENWKEEEEKGDVTFCTSEYVPTLKTALDVFQNVIKVTKITPVQDHLEHKLVTLKEAQYFAKGMGMVRHEMGSGKTIIIDLVRVGN